MELCIGLHVWWSLFYLVIILYKIFWCNYVCRTVYVFLYLSFCCLKCYLSRFFPPLHFLYGLFDWQWWMTFYYCLAWVRWKCCQVACRPGAKFVVLVFAAYVLWKCAASCLLLCAPSSQARVRARLIAALRLDVARWDRDGLETPLVGLTRVLALALRLGCKRQTGTGEGRQRLGESPHILACSGPRRPVFWTRS